MFQVKYQTPTRRKSTIDDSTCTYTEKRLKCSTADSTHSGDPKFKKQISNWQQSHDNRRERRLNSMLKIRKQKLQEITEENQKIFIRINEQQSHYASYKIMEKGDRAKNKENEGDDGLMGHLREFQTPACFIIGERGIMCEQRLGVDNIILKKAGRMLPQLSKNDPNQKEYRSIDKSSISRTKQLLFYPTNKQRRLPDIYMMI